MSKILILIILHFVKISIGQSDKQFVLDFLLEDELKSENLIKDYEQYDFSNVWNKTANEFIYGIIGEDHQRIRIKLLSIKKIQIIPVNTKFLECRWLKRQFVPFLEVLRSIK